MVDAHRRWITVTEALARNLQGFCQQLEAAPRGGAEVVFIIHPIAYPPEGVIRASFRKQPITGTQQMLSHGWALGELGVGIDDHCIFSLVFPHDGIKIAYLASPYFL